MSHLPEGGLESLPPSWQLATLGEVSLRGGEYGSPSPAMPFTPDLPRYVRITDIDGGGGLSINSRASIGWAVAQPYFLSSGDLCFARSGATVGKTYLYDQRDGVCAFAGYVIRFSIDPARAIPDYIYFWTQGAAYRRWVSRVIKQGAQPNINAREYAAHQFPLPPLDEQREIVEVLDSVDESIRLAERLIAKLEQAERGLLQEVICVGSGGKSAVELGAYLDRIEAGSSPDLPGRRAGPGEWGVLKVSAVRPWGFDPNENKVVTNSALIDPTLEVLDGDLIITRANTPELVGLACLFESHRGV